MRMGIRKRKKKYGDIERRADALIRVGCLVFLLIMTRVCAAAEEAVPAVEETVPAADEATEKTTIRIVLRPEKTEGEPDPDLTGEIRRQISAQAGEAPELLDRLCACVDWTYLYDDEVRPPGEAREAGESDIYLTFADDPEYVFEGWTFPDEEPEPADEAPEPVDEAPELADEEPEQDTFPEAEEDACLYQEGFEETGEEDYEEGFEVTEESSCEEDYGEAFEVTEEAVYEEAPEAFEDGGYQESFTGPLEVADQEEGAGEELRSFLTTRPQEEEPAAGEKASENTEPEEDSGVPEENEAEAAPAEEFHIQDETEEFHIKDEEESVEEEKGAEQEVPVEYASDEKNTAPQKYEKAYAVPQELMEGFTELIREPEREEAEEADVQTQVQLLRTDSGSREEDLTDMYREALAGTDPGRLDWETLLAPLPENDGTYVLRTTETDREGNEKVQETAFSVNRFGSVYTYNDVVQALRGNTVKNVDRALVISEYNPDEIRDESREVALTLDGKKRSQVLYSVSRNAGENSSRAASGETKNDSGSASDKETGKAKKWNRYDYVIAADNFREDGVYSLNISSRDAVGNTSEMHRYNGGGIAFTVDGSPPELQAVQGLEQAAVNGRKANVKVTAFDTVGLARLSAFVDGKLMAAADTFPDRHRAELAFSIPQGPAQRVRIVAEDTAGNVLDTDEKTAEKEYTFKPAFPFNRQITVTPPPEAEVPKPRGPVAVLLILIIGCTGVSAVMLKKIFRKEKKLPSGMFREMDMD